MTIQSSDNKNIEEFGWIGDIQAKIRAAAAAAKASPATSRSVYGGSSKPTQKGGSSKPIPKGWTPPVSKKTNVDNSDSAFGIPGLDSILGPIKKFFENLINTMKDKIGGALNKIVNIKDTIVDKLSGLFDPLVQKFEGPIRNIIIAGAILVIVTILGQVVIPIFSYLVPVDCPNCSCPSCPPKLATV